MNIQLRRAQIIAIVGPAVAIFGLLCLTAILPMYSRHAVRKQVVQKKGRPMRDIWSKLSFVTEAHVYVFNVTNHLEIGMGAKPIVREIGPFVYDVYREKVDQVNREEDDTVSYMRNTYHFNSFKSKGLSDELEVYFPHLFIMGLSNGPMKDQPSLVSWATHAVDAILDKPTSAFYRTKVRTALFDGFPIECAGVVDYFGKLVCNELYARHYDYTLRRRGDTFYTSVFGWLNGSYDKEKRIGIERDVKTLKNRKPNNIPLWKYDRCDAFVGTDASIFRPFLKPIDDIPIAYAPACRNLVLNYHSKVEFDGLDLLRYTTKLITDGNHVPENKRHCTTTGTCQRKGMLELYRYHNIPLIVSNPHFYGADPYYLTTVDTLTPDEDKHVIYIDFESTSDTAVRVHARLQFNFELFPIEKFRLARNYTYSMLPFLWVDEITVLPEFLIKDTRMPNQIIRIARIFGYVYVFVQLSLVAFVAYRARKWNSNFRQLGLAN